MARHIDADKALKFIRETNANYHWLSSQYSASWIYDFIESQPTADVVPKSEYDSLKSQFDALDHECDRLEMAETKRHDAIEQAKSEVAREIFEEIEKIHLHITNEFDLRRYEELKKKYTEDRHDSD